MFAALSLLSQVGWRPLLSSGSAEMIKPMLPRNDSSADRGRPELAFGIRYEHMGRANFNRMEASQY